MHLDTVAFDQAVKDAIDALPAHAKPHLANVVLSVEPLPSEDEIREGLSPTILGVFQGTPIDERSPVDAAQHQTARITCSKTTSSASPAPATSCSKRSASP